ncbi:P-loop NTPase fold protein [Amycolatopsis magusensis]|uniref:P-loop NTPase fold protein n=1 Tax=Amycolatopsis magusensis TaxID=882444 RepID=UPI0024A88F10|nr:P-loop NTPase fold protein [Amycolatopsis magusensis]MDI5977491.1 P-loop NTPase fold protein [Amycolatopsis magusensis]
MTAPDEEERLGEIGSVVCSVVRTERPWDLGLDALVIPVGGGLGELGEALAEHYPDVGWEAVPFGSITPIAPWTMHLPGPGPRLAIFVASGSSGDPERGNAAKATAAAITTARRSGVAALGMPLLSSGRLGNPPALAAGAVVPAAVAALAEQTGLPLRRLVFFAKSRKATDAIRETFAGLGEDRVAPEELAGGVSRDLVDPNRGIPLGEDQLGVAAYVSMLATVIADPATPLPLSVGVFGEWGSGKSFFMGLLRAEVDRLASQDIVQIGFNAWHYADSDLWASLGDEIFRQLAGVDAKSPERAERIRAELSERLDQRRQLEAETQEARETAAELQSEVDTAIAGRERSARLLIKALRNSSAFKDRVDRLWSRLGVTDEAEQGKLLAEQLRGSLDDAAVLRRMPGERHGKLALVLAAVVLVAAFLVPLAWEWLAGAAALFTLFAGTGITVLSRVRSGLRDLRELSEDLHTGITDAAEQELPEQLQALRAAEAEQRVAEAQLAEVVAQVGALGRQLTRLTPGHRLYTFLADRARSDSYAGNLGVISTIRKDFEQLVKLMAEWRESPDDGVTPRRPVDRIVLYIDDLDRCSPRQVVEVLQAVHLLLAFELFVVVVGVDPRWLLRALRSHYAEILADGEGDARVTPEDYLEKIVNIPLVLPGLAPDGMSRLLRSLVRTEQAAPAAVRKTGRVPDEATIEVEAGSEVDTQRQATPAAEPRPLTEAELDLLSTLDSLVGTPREAKRLVNLYRMVRATRDLSMASRFLGQDGEPGEYQAVVLLLALLTAHARLLCPVLDTRPEPARGIRGGLVHRDPSSSWAQFVADLGLQQDGTGWMNPIAGPIEDDRLDDWRHLHAGLSRVSDAVALPDVSALQLWAPRIRRFSYVLVPRPGQRR